VIVEWILGLASTLVSFIGTLFQGWSAPAWTGQFATSIASFIASANGVGVWFPFATLSTVLASLAAFYGIVFGAKLVLRLVAFVPQIGGAG
jgi:hypothetical protein